MPTTERRLIDALDQRDELLSALKALMEQFDAGMFYRNTDNDGQSDWAIRAIRPLTALAKARDVIAKTEGVEVQR